MGAGVLEQLAPFHVAPGVAAQKSCSHWVEDEPLLLMHEAMLLASVSGQRLKPVAVDRWASRRALCGRGQETRRHTGNANQVVKRQVDRVVEPRGIGGQEPMICPVKPMNRASAHWAAIVVSSLTTKAEEVRLLHGPLSDIIAIPELLPLPASPPVAST